MRLFFSLLVFLLILSNDSAIGQSDLTLVARLPYDTILNNCWGYVHPDGTEYAFAGTSTGLSVVSLEDPSNPQELYRISEPYALWRDIFTYGNFAYAVADQFSSDEGVLILDLSPLPDPPIVDTWRPFLPTFGDSLNRCHNLSIDESGILYLSGCNVNSGGVFMADLTSDPWEPQFIGPAEDVYSHDSHVDDGILYSSNIQEGFFSVIDISDPQQPQLLAQQPTPGAFTHNAWTSDDGQTLFTTDEKPNAAVASYDISDFGNIRELDQFRPLETIGQGVIPHNVQVIDDFAVISYYTDGCIVLDASRPHNLIQIAQYDTYDGDVTGFRGNWGAYLWYPSGHFIASDITEGLHIFKPELQRACYLEGKITNAFNGANLSGAKVIILSNQLNQEFSDLQGKYATGLAQSGTYTLEVSKPGFYSFSQEVELINGELTELDVALTPLPEYVLKGRIVDALSGNGIPNAWITLTDGELDFETQADEAGYYTLENVFRGDYSLLAAQWGYTYYFDSLFTLSQDLYREVALETGYQDLFEFDLGWNISGNAMQGIWERGKPNETLTGSGRISNPNQDSPNDIGGECYVTGNTPGSVGEDEVDLTTTLESPDIDVGNYLVPTLTFDFWFFNAWTSVAPDDTLKVFVNYGEKRELANIWTESESFWQSDTIDLSPFTASGPIISIDFEVADLPNNEHLLEAAVDNFQIIEGAPVPDLSIDRDIFKLDAFPNPATSELEIYYQVKGSYPTVLLEIHDISGKRLRFFYRTHPTGKIKADISGLPPGMYFISLLSDGKRSPPKKFIKQGR